MKGSVVRDKGFLLRCMHTSCSGFGISLNRHRPYMSANSIISLTKRWPREDTLYARLLELFENSARYPSNMISSSVTLYSYTALRE